MTTYGNVRTGGDPRQRCVCGQLAVGTVETGRDDAPVCTLHAVIEASAGADVTIWTQHTTEGITS
jgi:hypothetical protein